MSKVFGVIAACAAMVTSVPACAVTFSGTGLLTDRFSPTPVSIPFTFNAVAYQTRSAAPPFYADYGGTLDFRTEINGDVVSYSGAAVGYGSDRALIFGNTFFNQPITRLILIVPIEEPTYVDPANPRPTLNNFSGIEFWYNNRSFGGVLTSVTTAVPEPSSWALSIAGLGLVGGALRRRARAAKTEVTAAA